ncbi:MAG: phospholipase D family protein [Deltaproteobacteria bacterium]|nr:phospholipase D family protein [Deltaproteobacteria bacterium]
MFRFLRACRPFSCRSAAAVSLLLIALLFAGSAVQAVPVQVRQAPPIDVYFSPRAGATEAICREIAQARSEILVQAYSFTSAPIAQALLAAHKRGIKVAVILDKSQKTQKYSSATFLTNAAIPTYIDSRHAIAHNKIILIDGTVVITGSFNFTKAAEEKNAENLLIIRSAELAKLYRENWQQHRDHSEG